MPRPLRLILPGVAAHIRQRGNNKAACFVEDADRLVYLAHLRELCKTLDCALHAYCLMTNHVHLLLTPVSATACASMMRDLGQRYVQYFNRRYQRSGTLWEGRYRSSIAESAYYVLACYRYIELNPVDAGMVQHPSAYLWSSYAANSGMRADPSLSPHAEYLALATDAGRRQAAYRALLEDRMDEALRRTIREALDGGYPLASDGFKSAVIEPLGHKTAPGKPGPRRNSGSDPELGKQNSGSDPDLFSAGGAS